MQARLRAIEYLYRVTTGHRGRTVQVDDVLNGRPCTYVRPEFLSKGIALLPVICVHGMSVHGYRDVRMLNVAHALAALGHEVVIPSYPEIQDLRIVAASVDSIRADIGALAGRAERRVGILTASFSGGLSLVAASHPDTAAEVAALLVVGSYCHVDTTMDFFLHRETIDPYGLFIVLKNFLPYRGPVDERLLRALHVAACDDGFQRKAGERQLEPFLKSCPPQIGTEFQRFLSDREYRLSVWNEIVQVPEAKRALEAMDVLRVIDGLSASLCLLHGAHDIVIPPEESILLYNSVRERIPSLLTVTSIIDHGNVRMGWGVAKEFLSLINTMALFFRSLV